jgi:HSP20 family protein
MDDFFTTMPSLFRDELQPGLKHSVPVNIRETENQYELEIVAPGLQKEDFKVNLDNNILTVSAERKTEEKKETEKEVRREYRFQSFTRSFTLDEKINAEKIAAKYINGVLTLNLPKKEEVKTSAKQITIE